MTLIDILCNLLLCAAAVQEGRRARNAFVAAWNAAVEGRQLNEMRPRLPEGPAAAAAAVQDAPAREHRSRYACHTNHTDIVISIYKYIARQCNHVYICIIWLHGLQEQGPLADKGALLVAYSPPPSPAPSPLPPKLCSWQFPYNCFWSRITGMRSSPGADQRCASYL